MKIYTPTSPDKYELCHPVNVEDFENINILINGTPRATSWKPIAMSLVYENDDKKLLESDSPWLGGHALIFRPRAIKSLDSVLRKYGELLPLLCVEADLAIYNPTCLLDALDEDASSVIRFSGGRIMRVNQYLFRSEIVGENDIFKIRSLRSSPTFVSQRFVDLWNSTGLIGLEFNHVWAPT